MGGRRPDVQRVAQDQRARRPLPGEAAACAGEGGAVRHGVGVSRFPPWRQGGPVVLRPGGQVRRSPVGGRVGQASRQHDGCPGPDRARARQATPRAALAGGASAGAAVVRPASASTGKGAAGRSRGGRAVDREGVAAGRGTPGDRPCSRGDRCARAHARRHACGDADVSASPCGRLQRAGVRGGAGAAAGEPVDAGTAEAGQAGLAGGRPARGRQSAAGTRVADCGHLCRALRPGQWAPSSGVLRVPVLRGAAAC